MNLILEYFTYCLKAKRRFGIHSPFVYNFGDKCLSYSIPAYYSDAFNKTNVAFINNNTKISVNDLGAGSKKMDNKRSVKSIAKNSGIGKKYGSLLFKIAAHYQPINILELGTSLGLGTLSLAMGSPKAKITTVEGCSETLAVAKEYFPVDLMENISFENASFYNYLTQIPSEKQFDLVFIDGDHRKKSLFQQLELLNDHIHDETIILLDDIRWTQDMLEAWQSLIQNPDYHLTLDLFRMGILMKRHHQAKEHFVVRY